MSLVNTLAKVAVGIAVAKGMKSLTGGGKSSGGGGLADLLGGALAGGSGKSAGGLGDLLGGALQQGGSSGGIGDLLGQLSGGASKSGGIGDLLGQLGGMSGGKGPGLEDLMGGLLKGGMSGQQGGIGDLLGQLGGGGAAGGLGGLLTSALENRGQVQEPTSDDDEAAAGVMIRAMMQAAKADGNIDEQEKEKLLGNLGELDQSEIDFINAEMSRPIDIKGLASDVPSGSEKQAYLMSVMAINVDSKQEVTYLNDLAGALGLSAADQQGVHQMLGL